MSRRKPFVEGDIIRLNVRTVNGWKGIGIVGVDQGSTFDMVHFWRLDVPADDQLCMSVAMAHEVSVALRREEVALVVNSEKHKKSCETEW